MLDVICYVNSLTKGTVPQDVLENSDADASEFLEHLEDRLLINQWINNKRFSGYLQKILVSVSP